MGTLLWPHVISLSVGGGGARINYQGWPDLNHDLNQAIKVTKSDFFDF